VTVGLILFMLGFLADLSAVNRRLLERIDWRLRRLEDAQSRGNTTSIASKRDAA
jgi:hypothetical protein